jgi:hypothetical protein
MLVPDLLHEFELGVWKALFTHLIRVLYAAAPNGSLVAELNKRCDNYLECGPSGKCEMSLNLLNSKLSKNNTYFPDAPSVTFVAL